MPKKLANTKHVLRRQLRLICLALVLTLCAGLCATSAQQTPQGDKQQRPRRVGTTPPTPTTTATPTTATPTPATTTPRASQTQTNADAGEEVGEGDVVRVETQLVSVPAVVYDQTGRPLVTLRPENFTLYEDGRPQRISNFGTTEAPFEVALLLDTSGSTRADVALIRRAANAFVDALRANDRVAIVAFNTAETGTTKLATVEVLTKLTSNRATLRKAVESIGSSNGTPFYDALERIAQDVFSEAPGDATRGRRAVVALTDGVDSTSDAEYTEARNRLLRAGLSCYFIQVNTEDFVEDRLLKDCQDDGRLGLSRTQLQRYRRIFAPRSDPSDYSNFCSLGQFERMQISRDLYNLARQEMNDLARASGGRNFTAADLRDARAAFAQVAEEIGTQYSLGYYPTNKTRDGRFRAIKVEVKGITGGAQVRAREGYYAPKS
jgi:Ca-activated chloride channel family protein